MPPPIDPLKIVVFSGAGISAESGIATFRDKGGLWDGAKPQQVASATAWANDPATVLEFFKHRVAAVAAAVPNAAHLAVSALQDRFEVVVITQNIDDLHERAGSTHVIHLHGSILEARADGDAPRVYHRGFVPLAIGDVDDHGRQLRPNVVFFGEDMLHHDLARRHLQTAGRVLVVGTSLSVYPAAGLLKAARFRAEKVIVAHAIESKPFGFKFLKGNATGIVPALASQWCEAGARRIADPPPATDKR
jgi:NAD-dependent deacetylase